MSAIVRFVVGLLVVSVLTPSSANSQTACTADTLRSGAARGDLSGINACLKGKPDIDQANTDGLTALMLAAAGGHRDVVLALIGAGANVNLATPTDGLTPLLVAAHWGHLSTVEALVDKGANPLHKDKGDRNAVDWATGYADGRQQDAIATAKYLMSKGTPLVQQSGFGLFASVGSRPNLQAMVARAGGKIVPTGQAAPARSGGATDTQSPAAPTLAILFLERRDAVSVELRLIAVATQAQADIALARLGKGEPFARVAEQLSVHATKSNGGYIGRFDLADVREDFRAALAGVSAPGYTKVIPYK